MALLSIGIPTWNRCEELKKCLNELVVEIEKLNNKKLVEVIVSDNGSQDDTKSLCQSFSEKYSFIKYFRSSRNKGSKYNFVNVIKKSTGKFFWYIGDDDLIVKDKLGNVISMLNDNCNIPIFILDYIDYHNRNKTYLDIKEDKFIKFEEFLSMYFFKSSRIDTILINRKLAIDALECAKFSCLNEIWVHLEILLLMQAISSESLTVKLCSGGYTSYNSYDMNVKYKGVDVFKIFFIAHYNLVKSAEKYLKPMYIKILRKSVFNDKDSISRIWKLSIFNKEGNSLRLMYLNQILSINNSIDRIKFMYLLSPLLISDRLKRIYLLNFKSVEYYQLNKYVNRSVRNKAYRNAYDSYKDR